MCPCIWTYLNPPVKTCLVAQKLRLISAHFALGRILRRWFDDSSKALLLLHKITASHWLVLKSSATTLARRWRQHSPSISALNKLADGPDHAGQIGRQCYIVRSVRSPHKCIILHPFCNLLEILGCFLREVYVIPHPAASPTLNEIPKMCIPFDCVGKAWSFLKFVNLGQ
jgi:hypothetical protein